MPAPKVDRWRPVVVVTVALAVRLAVLASTYPDRFFFGKYLVLGRELAQSNLISARPFSYSPIYCYFIAVGRLLFGDTLWPILLIQSILGSLVCLLLYLIAKRFVGHSWAMAAALLAAFYRSFVLYDVTFLSDSLGLLFQLLLVWSLMRLEASLNWRKLAVVGALIGLCILQRPHCMLLLPGLFIGLRIALGGWRDALRGLLIAGVFSALVTLPIVAQNYRLTGNPGTTASNPGYIFYSSNNSSSYGFRYSPPELYYRGVQHYERQPIDGVFLGDAEIAAMISGAIVGEPMSLSSSSRYYLDFTLTHMKRYPGHYLGMILQRAQLVFHAFEAHDVSPVFARYGKVARWTPITFGWLVPFGLLGLGLSLANWRRYLWLYLLLLSQLSLLLGFYVVVRFRLPIEAWMLLFSVVAGQQILDRLRARDVRWLAPVSLSLVALAVLTHWLPNETADRAHGRNMEILLEDASRLLQRGQTDEAARRLSRLIKQDREILQRGFRARALLSQSTGQQGLDRWDPRQTLGMLETKKREHRLTLKELRYLAQLHLQAGALEAGSAALSEYLDRRPQDPLMRFELGRLQHAQGKKGSARTTLQLAIEDGLLFTTRGMHGCELLARLANDAGDVETARRWIEQASQLSILLPWYSSDTSSRELSQRLKESAGYKPPGVLNDLVPY